MHSCIVKQNDSLVSCCGKAGKGIWSNFTLSAFFTCSGNKKGMAHFISVNINIIDTCTLNENKCDVDQSLILLYRNTLEVFLSFCHIPPLASVDLLPNLDFPFPENKKSQ